MADLRGELAKNFENWAHLPLVRNPDGKQEAQYQLSEIASETFELWAGSDDAIERAAQAMYERENVRWDEAWPREPVKQEWRARAKAALESAIIPPKPGRWVF